jgi:hypothetical protein
METFFFFLESENNVKSDLEDTEVLQRFPDANTQNEYNVTKGDDQNDILRETDNYFGTHLRQIFVTKNPLLCVEVERNFRELRRASGVEKAHFSTESRPLPTKLQDLNDLQYPLFITFRKLLQYLDKSTADTNQTTSEKAQLTVRYNLQVYNRYEPYNIRGQIKTDDKKKPKKCFLCLRGDRFSSRSTQNNVIFV